MRRRLGSVTLAAAAALGLAAPAMAADDALNAYRVKPTAENKKELAAAGYDLAEGDRGRYIEIYATRSQARSLKSEGIAAKQVTSFKAAAAPEDYIGDDAEYDVWTRYDAVPGDDKEQYVEQYQRIAARADREAREPGQDPSRPRHLGDQDHQGRQDHRGRQPPGRALQRAAARPRVAGRRDLPADAGLLRRQLRHRRARHAARRRERAVVLVHLEPGRLRVHVHGRQPPLAQEHGRQRRRRHARRAGRRRRPEPQLRHELGSRQRGVVRRSRERDVPRHGAGLRAGDQGDEEPLGPRGLRVPEERPHRGRAAAVSAGLPALHAHAGQRHLHRAGGRRRRARDRRQGVQRGRRGLGDPGQPARRGHVGEPLRPGHLRRAVHHERRHVRRRLPSTAS